jgi:hypothetical protein
MDAEHAYLAPLLAYYDPLLARYATMIIRNEIIARALVNKVLADQFDIDELRPSDYLRNKLKTDLRALCLSWKLQEDAVNFNGRPINENDLNHK